MSTRIRAQIERALKAIPGGSLRATAWDYELVAPPGQVWKASGTVAYVVTYAGDGWRDAQAGLRDARQVIGQGVEPDTDGAAWREFLA